MNSHKNKKLKRLLRGAVFAFSLSLGFIAVSAQTIKPSKRKIGDDVRQKLKEGGATVDVIINPVGGWTPALDAFVNLVGGKVKHSYKSMGARHVQLPAWAVSALEGRADIRYVSQDARIYALGHVSLTSGADDAAQMSGNSLMPYDGTGIGIAVLDSGIYQAHSAFGGRVIYSQDFTGEGRTDDPYGHGTHVASIAAGNGSVSAGAYQGIAPNANIINLRVLNSQGQGTQSSLLAALDWVMTNKAAYNIRVVNMSLGTPAINSYKNDPICQAVRRLVDAGVVVVAAAGNDGKDSSINKIYGAIHSPGDEPSAITVGAANTFGTDSRSDDGVATFSSRGPTRGYWTDDSGVKHYDNLVKPDLVAPGNKIIDAESPGNYLVTNHPSLDAGVSSNPTRAEMYLNGTSMATPVVAGAAALLLQANPSLTPNEVRLCLEYTAQQLPGFNQLEQGAGEVNIAGAVQLAKLIRADLNSSTPLGAALLTSAAPAAQTTIAGYTFTWSQGLVADQSYYKGSDLVNYYQKIYGLGVIMGDGTIVSNGALLTDSTMMSSGVIMGDNITTSLGVIMGDGTVFCSDGVLLGDGALLGDGVIMGDGALLGDGVIMGDSLLQALSKGIKGDDTAMMKAVADITRAP